VGVESLSGDTKTTYQKFVWFDWLFEIPNCHGAVSFDYGIKGA
jgi:hypothetical protein